MKPRFHIGLAAIVFAVGAPALFAETEPLKLIPAKVSGVVAIRNLAASTDRLNGFLSAVVHSNTEVIESEDLDVVATKLGLPAGIWDENGPVLIVLTRPEISAEDVVVCFKPKIAAAFNIVPAGRAKGFDGPDGRYYAIVRNGFVMAASKMRTLRPFRQLSTKQSLYAALDKQQRELFSRSDIVLHIPLEIWRPMFSPFVSLTMNVLKYQLSAVDRQSGANEGEALLDWVRSGVDKVVGEMTSLTLAASVDRERASVTHYHTFAREGEVFGYLSKCRRSNAKPFESLPDEPFVLMAHADWRCPVDDALSVRLNRHVLEQQDIDAKLSSDESRLIREAVEGWSGIVSSSSFMISSASETQLPLQIKGGYAVDDADEAMKQLKALQKRSSAVMSAFLPAGCFTDSRDEQSASGIKYCEMKFELEHLSKQAGFQAMMVYGDDCRWQSAKVDQRHLVYTVAEPPAGVVQLVDSLKKSPLASDNAAVKSMLAQLPHDSNLIVVVDLRRLLAIVPQLASDTLSPKPLDDSAYQPSSPKALLGWGTVIRPSSISGTFAIDAQSVERVIMLSRGLAKKMQARPGGMVRTTTRVKVRPDDASDEHQDVEEPEEPEEPEDALP